MQKKIKIPCGDHSVKLTYDEIRAVCDYQDHEFLLEDVRTRMEEIDLDTEIIEKLNAKIDSIADLAKHYIEGHDHLWDCYWSDIEAAIKDYQKEIEVQINA